MHKKLFCSLGLFAVISLVTGCAQLPGLNRSPQVAAPEPAAVTQTEVTDLSRRVLALENWEVRRTIAQEYAANLGRSSVVAQVAPKSLACVRLPKALTQSLHYADFRYLMEAAYTTSCLYEVDKLAEAQAASKPASLPKPPPVGKRAPKSIPKK